MVMDDTTADRQDVRPLKIGLLNLMPKKEQTETQFARLIGATPLQIDLTLIELGTNRKVWVGQKKIKKTVEKGGFRL